MKKILLWSMSICLIAGLSLGCGKKSEEKKDEEKKTVLLGKSFAKDKEEFSENIKKFVSILKYEISENEDGCRYVLYDEEEDEINREYDCEVNFDDESSVELPVTFEELDEQGWITFADKKTQISNQKKQPVSFTNEDGEKITLQTIYTEGLDYNGVIACDLSECTFYHMEITPYEESEDGYVLNDEAPGFTICEKVTGESGLDSVLNELGEPNSIEFFEEDASILVEYENIGSSDNKVHLSFEFDGSENKMKSVKLYCESERVNW